jgi:hypothetical protein
MPQWPTGPKPSTLAQPSGRWPAHAASARSAHGHHPGARPARRGAQQCGGGLSVTRYSVHPPSWLRLQATTLRPRRGGRRRGAHR